MCTVLVLWRCYRDVPVLIAANRDELLSRPSAPPAMLRRGITGGRDLLAGGTWLAVSHEGRVCCVTNRRSESAGEIRRDPERRSRGEIPVLVLEDAATNVPALLATLGPGIYNPVNVLHASDSGVQVAHIDDTAPPRIVELTPGAHVLTVRDIDHPTAAKDVFLLGALREVLAAGATPGAALTAMEELLRSHHSPSGDWLDAACIHGDEYGTVSAATVTLGGDGRVAYRHAPGRPCVTPFAEVPLSA